MMAIQIRLEMCVESLDYALAAESGGADRIELCHDLSCGGVTPNAELIRAVRHQVSVPIHALIRPRAGDFFYSTSEFETIKHGISLAKDIGLDGIVLGVLDRSGQVDLERTRALVQAAHPLPVTFHRAFDQCPDLTAALEAVIETGAKRILTSGGKASVADGLVEVTHLLEAARDRIVIMPGGGIRITNIESILRGARAREIHTSLNSAAPESTMKPERDVENTAANLFAEKVRQFKSALDRLSLIAPTQIAPPQDDQSA